MKGLSILALAAFLVFPANAAIWKGQLDLGDPPQAFIPRDIYNGQWRGGYAKNLWELQKDDKQVFHVGYAQTWNTEHGNAAVGPIIGKDLTFSEFATLAHDIMRLPDTNVPKWVGYLGDVLSVDAHGGYMLVHTSDVRGPFIYGFGFKVDLSDVFTILANGL